MSPVEIEISGSDLDHAWAAGFFDGEGCLLAYGKYSKQLGGLKLQLEISCSQVDVRPLCMFKDRYGGCIRSYPEKRSNRRQSSMWSIQSAHHARHVVEIWIPYLVVKKEQAETFIELAALVKTRGGKVRVDANPEEMRRREELVHRLKALKKVTSCP